MQVLEHLVQRATNLYTLPAVAVEVLRLTNQANVDARAFKECIERDPALTAKILKVVNSSLFGVGSEVDDLNQALALLGTKTLKLLVLGFSLPDKLFADVAADPLSRYWVTALTRAVGARDIARSLWAQDGDSAFIAGLLEDIGQLVLMKELGEPYARLVDGAWREEEDLAIVERAALGFDHRQLSTALFAHWGLPETLSLAIQETRDRDHLMRLDAPHATLARILHLASLLTELVGQHRLSVLPDLVESGEAYIGMSRPQLDAMVETLEPAVRSLADVLSVHLPDDNTLADMVAEAHRRLANATEEACVPLARLERCEEQLGEDLLADARELAKTTAEFLGAIEGSQVDERRPCGEGVGSPGVADRTTTQDHRFDAASRQSTWRHDDDEDSTRLLGKLEAAISQARNEREALSLLMLEAPSPAGAAELESGSETALLKTLSEISAAFAEEGGMVASESGRTRVVILRAHERSSAVACTYGILRDAAAGALVDGETMVPAIWGGIASVAIVSKNFAARQLLEAAKRCLYAASQSGPGAVKSIELY